MQRVPRDPVGNDRREIYGETTGHARTPSHSSGLTPAQFLMPKDIADGRKTCVHVNTKFLGPGKILLREGYITNLGTGVRATPAGLLLVATHRADDPPANR